MRLLEKSIAAKLAVGFGLCLLLLVTMVGFNFTALQRLEKLYRQTLRNATAVELASDAQHIGNDLGVLIGHAVINRNQSKSEQEWVVAKEENLAKLQKLAGFADTPEEQAIVREAQTALAELISTYEQEMLPLIRKGEGVTERVSEVDARIDTRIEAISLALEWIAKIESEENVAAEREFHAVLENIIRSGWAIALVGLLAVLSVAVLTTRRIVRPLSDVTHAAQEVGKGNYLVDVKHSSNDEIGVLANAFRQMLAVVKKRTSELEDTNTRLNSEIVERKQAEEEVRLLNAGLERRVAERTADLAATVASLQQEVVERRKAEAALRESEKLLRVVLEILPVGIWVTGRREEDIIMINRASKMIWCGKQYCDLVMTGEFKGWRRETGKRMEKEEWALARAISSGETIWNDIVEIESFDGSRKIVSNSVVPIMNSDREIIAVVEVMEDITERSHTEERLKASLDQLRNLSAYLETARENERSRIAREIHDELGQLLTVLKFDISWLKGKIPGTQPAVIEKAGSMMELIDTTISTVQRIATDLRPLILDHLGLAAAIEWYVHQFQTRTGVDCRLDMGTGEIVVDQERSIALFRIFQEGLTNVMRHADASRIDVFLKIKGRTVHLEIADNGKGINRKELSDPRSVGLTGMRERAAILGGRVTISGVRDKGTKLKVIMPLIDKEEPDDQDSHS